MPELPEVETLVRGLKKEITGKKISLVEVEKGYATTPPPSIFVKTLVGTSVESVSRIAKITVIKLKNIDKYLTFHMAMTGRLLYRKAGDREDSHLRVKLKFTDKTELRFCDVRMFGYARILTREELDTLTKKHGPTPLNKNLDAQKLLDIVSKRKTQIKRALLEQDLVAGLGNIYANDSLWIAKIHPESLTHTLSLKEAGTLLEAMRTILVEGIEHGGSTLDDEMFVNIYGEKGSHQNYFRIYGKNGKPCPRCKTPIELLQIGGRSTFYCPNCQKKTSVKKVLQPALSI